MSAIKYLVFLLSAVVFEQLTKVVTILYEQPEPQGPPIIVYYIFIMSLFIIEPFCITLSIASKGFRRKLSESFTGRNGKFDFRSLLSAWLILISIREIIRSNLDQDYFGTTPDDFRYILVLIAIGVKSTDILPYLRKRMK